MRVCGGVPVPGRGTAPPARKGERRARAEGRGRRGSSGGRSLAPHAVLGSPGLCVGEGPRSRAARRWWPVVGEGPGPERRRSRRRAPGGEPRSSRPGRPPLRGPSPRVRGPRPPLPSPPAIPAFALSGRLAPRPSRARGRAPGTRAPAAARGTPRRRPPLRAFPRVAAAPRCVPRAPRWVGVGGLGGVLSSREDRRAAPSAARPRSRAAVARGGFGEGGRRGEEPGRRCPCSLQPPPPSPPRARARAAFSPPSAFPPPVSPSPSSKPGRAPARAAGSCSPPAPAFSAPPSLVVVVGGAPRASAVAFPCRGPPLARASPFPLPASRAPPSRPQWRALRDATSDQTWRPAEFKHISQRRKRN